jgi:arylsulfatase A-like enzyme
MADDLGWGDPGFNGNTVIQTPNLDDMAKSGLRFTRFYSGAPVCSPTRGSCLTGRHPYRYGVFFANVGHMRKQEITLAEALKTQGYTTGHFGKWHLGTLDPNFSGKGPKRKPKENFSTPGMNGFDEWFSTEYAVPTWDPQSMGFGENCPYYHNGEKMTSELKGDDSKIIMDRALPFIENAVNSNQPFFTVVWFHAPHAPVVAGPEFRKLYSDYSEGEQHYYGCITALDRQVGRLRKKLQDWGVSENTMVWFCSDNGPEGDDGTQNRHRGSAGPFRGRKRSLFEGGIRVPALLEWPSQIKAGQTTDIACSTSDYFPTILEILGFKMKGQPTPIDGTSLVPLLKGQMQKRPIPIAFETRGEWGSRHSRGSASMALIDNQYKLLTDMDKNSDQDMLIDLLKDPKESTNLANEKPDILKSMKQDLKKWQQSCQKSLAGQDYTDD